MSVLAQRLANLSLDPNLVQQTIAAMKQAAKNPVTDPAFSGFAGLLAKASTFTEASSATDGLTYYDLEAGAKFLVPVITPLRNETPRASGKGGIEADWRAVTGINTTAVRAGVSVGNRGGVIAVQTKDFSATYKGIGLEANIDWEAEYAAMGFDDVRSIAGTTLLWSLMIAEEQIILGGNRQLPLGTTPTPTVTASTTGGALAAATYSVICVALTLDGFVNGSVSGGIQGSITRTNADSSTDTFGGGAAKQSANQTATVSSGSTGSLAVSVAPVKGAYGYAWFWGAAGSEVLGAITPSPSASQTNCSSSAVNSLVITGTASGTQTASSLGTSDNSSNALVFDGLLTIPLLTGANGYYAVQATGTAGTGTPLTADGEGGIVEIDTALRYFWDNWRLSPSEIWVNSQEALNISKKIGQGPGSGASNLRFVRDVKDGLLVGAVLARSYLNRFSMTGAAEIPIRLHPSLPAGTILFNTKVLPYSLSNVPNVSQIRTRRDYFMIDWPWRSRRYEYGVYADEVLQCYAPFSIGQLTNIANG
jgi:hypothetical protein